MSRSEAIEGQAQGVVMARDGVNAASARDSIRRWSDETGVPMPDLCAAIVASAYRARGT